MENPTNDYIQIIKAFGKQDYVILQKDYQQELKNNPLLLSLWTVGKWFTFVANTQNWSIELVTGDAEALTGMSKEEVLQMQGNFISGFVFPDDFPFVTQTVQQAMIYVNSLPLNERIYVYVVFYFRAVKKSGEVITIQNQNIPLVFDGNNIPFIFANIITDVSHILPSNIPHAIVINKFSGEQFHLEPKNLKMDRFETQFSDRELEIIRLLIKGKTSREIGKELGISYETARTHRKNILTKANVSNTSQLVRYALLSKVV